MAAVRRINIMLFYNTDHYVTAGILISGVYKKEVAAISLTFFINCVVKPTALAVGYKTRPSNLRK